MELSEAEKIVSEAVVQHVPLAMRSSVQAAVMGKLATLDSMGHKIHGLSTELVNSGLDGQDYYVFRAVRTREDGTTQSIDVALGDIHGMTYRNPSPILQYFDYEHLPQPLQEVSKPIGDLARRMDEILLDGAEKSAGLRKLLEAKDCLVRAKLPKKD
jgi:hypothetical protein